MDDQMIWQEIEAGEYTGFSFCPKYGKILMETMRFNDGNNIVWKYITWR